ncbi:unnamed protein product, partial [Prorocentrum cordatum]
RRPAGRKQPSRAGFKISELESMFNSGAFLDHVCSVARDQAGCRMLQLRLEKAVAQGNTEMLGAILDRCLPSVVDLMMDPFGNYLCQKLMELCTAQQLEAMVERARGSLVKVSLNLHGARAVQKLIEAAQRAPNAQRQLAVALDGAVAGRPRRQPVFGQRAGMAAELEEPKKPQNPYWIWLSENREALAKEAGSGKAPVIGKLAGERWKALSAAAKKPFEDKAAKSKAEYEAAMEKFKAAGGQVGKRRLEKKEAKEGKAAKSSRKAKNEADKASGKPSRPQNAYWMWLAENRAALTKEAGNVKGSAISKLAGERWKALPAAKKKPFEEKAAELKATYDKALAEWKKTNGGGGGGDNDDEEEGAGTAAPAERSRESPAELADRHLSRALLAFDELRDEREVAVCHFHMADLALQEQRLPGAAPLPRARLAAALRHARRSAAYWEREGPLSYAKDLVAAHVKIARLLECQQRAGAAAEALEHLQGAEDGLLEQALAGAGPAAGGGRPAEGGGGQE